eukprot:Em0001g3672a
MGEESEESEPLVNGIQRGLSTRLEDLLTVLYRPWGRLGTFASKAQTSNARAGSKDEWGANVTNGGVSVPVVSWLDNQLLPANIRNNLQNLTSLPHIAGSPQNKMLAQGIYTQWLAYGFDDVQLVNYSVLLSYPNTSNPNVLRLESSTGVIVYEAHTKGEVPLTPGENDSTVAMPFNAYSGTGNATGRLVYVNNATVDDFLYLTTNLSYNLTNRVCIARYGDVFRGDKAHLAQSYGCSALIIYSDPQQYAPNGTGVYPNGPSLPPYGVQRGTLNGAQRDPLTSGIPAIDGVFREDYASVVKSGVVPSIPVQPIGYGDAQFFMSQLDAHIAPGSWTGGLNVGYFIWQSDSNTNQTFIQVNNYQEEQVIYDVIATMYGQVEPDQLVVLGNHRDAWVFGGVDPNSGTAVLEEIARALSNLRTKGWRPGRSLLLCSWDAEEYGLIGSTEWIEDKQKVLGPNTVAYLNVDFAVSAQVKCPNPAFDTVYDEWLHYKSAVFNGTKLPQVANGSGSDFTMFLQMLGNSCADFTYANMTGYAVYHSVHDNFYWMTNFGDPSFAHHQALGLVWSKAAILLATSPVLPYDPRDYAISLQNLFNTFVQLYGPTLQDQNITLNYIAEELDQFVMTSIALWNQLKNASANSSISKQALRILNNKLMNLERAFIIPEGLPGRQFIKHVIFAPSSVNSYASATFPGLSDAIFNALHTASPDWDEVPPDGFDAVSVQNVGSTYIIVSWDLPTDSNGILINFSLYCNGALAGVLPLTVISYDTTGLLLFTLYMYMSSSHAHRHCTPVGTWCGRHQCCSQPAQHEEDSPPGGPPDPESDTNDIVISLFINKIINLTSPLAPPL